MTSRQRVLAALSHQEPDRVPIDLAQAAGDGINIIAYRKLLAHLGLADQPVQVQDRRSQTALVQEEVLQRFQVDFRRLDLSGPDSCQEEPIKGDGYRDEWGVVRARPKDGFYYDVVSSPLADVDLSSAIKRHRWPDPDDPGRFRGLKERALQLYEDTDYAVVLQVNCGFFLRCAELRGWENFFVDLAANPAFASELMNHYLDLRLRIAGNALEQTGGLFDIVIVSSDDLGMLDRLLLSPQMYRTIIKPIQKRAFDFFKSRTPARRFYHCDGAIYPLLEDFIEIGTEVLNPVQVSAAGLSSTRRLKRDFGDRLCYWGAIDTHRVLPYGTAEAVKQEVRRRIGDLAPQGGYVLGPVHNIQPEVPPENVVAMYEAAMEFGHYPIEHQ